MKKATSILLTLMMGFSVVVGQTPEIEIKNVLQQYKTFVSINAAIHYYMYTSHSSTKITEEGFGIYQKQGDKLRVQQYGTEFIQNDKYILVKDDSSKAIVLTNAQKDQNTTFNVEKILSSYEKIEVIPSKKSGQKAFQIYFKQGASSEYEKAKIYFNEKTNILDEIVLYYGKAYDLSLDPKIRNYQKPKLRMVYTKFDTNPVFAKETFDISKYVNLNSKGKNTLKTKYSLYEFYDQTQ